MKIEHVYITGNRHDLRFTQCCVASIRRWYPDIPLSLLKDESNGSYGTRELEDAWDVSVFQSEDPLHGGWAKLEPMFRPGRQRCLILDSDIVFLGRVIDSLEALDADFVVEGRGGNPDYMARDYFDLVALKELDPEFVFPGYTFNIGQVVATSGILQRADFEPFVRFEGIPAKLHPDVFGGVHQGIVNYVLLKKAQDGELTLERLPFMEWAPTTPRPMTRTRKLTADSPYPSMVHWAGRKWKTFLPLRNGRLLCHFERHYYSRVPRGRRKRLLRSARLLWGVLRRNEMLRTPPPPSRMSSS
jgi:hypothetical protein